VFAVSGARAQLRPVQTGARNGTVAIVLGGLDSGAQVIAYPADAISDGISVKVRGPGRK
jgi:HlyD family secretion protein